MDKKIGCACGIAVTKGKAKPFLIKTTITEGSGKININGHVGYEFLNSIKNVIALCKQYHDLAELDITIHLPKIIDGPSAGLPLLISLLSALTQSRINQSIVFTGEVSRSGKILKVGQIKEKHKGAIEHKMALFVFPDANYKELTIAVGVISYWSFTHIHDVISSLF